MFEFDDNMGCYSLSIYSTYTDHNYVKERKLSLWYICVSQ